MAGDTSEHPNASQTHKILSAADMNSSLGSGVLSLSAPDQKTLKQMEQHLSIYKLLPQHVEMIAFTAACRNEQGH